MLFDLIDNLRSTLVFKILLWISRISMALAFIISGARKLPGLKFTSLPNSNPVGQYFDVMHDLGFYWNFIGYYQIIAGILILINKTAPLASLLMMPVTVNIMLVSFALNMRGTPLITTAMLAANIFLMIWYYKNYRSLFNDSYDINPGN